MSTSPLWKYPGQYTGRIEASNSLLASVLSSYYYGRTGVTWPEYDAVSGTYDTFYYEGYGYHTGHVWCAGDDSDPLPDYRFLVGDYAAVYQDLVNDLHTIDYVEYLCELRLSEDLPHAARRLVTSGTVEFHDDTSGVDYPFGVLDDETPPVLTAADIPVIVLPADATSLFSLADADRLVEVTGGVNAGIYRISAVPWNFGNVVADPGTGELLNGRVAILELAALGTFTATGPSASTTVEMLGMRWVARAYYDGTECNYLEEALHQGPGDTYPVAGYHSWARTMHVHMSKGASVPLRTIKFEVKLEAINSSWAIVAGAVGMSCRVPAPAFYVDELYRADQDEHIAVLNAVPQNGETGVTSIANVNLHVASFTAGATLNATAKVWLTRSGDRVRNLAYDQAAGGFQSGFDGPLSSATVHASPESGTNDELLLTIDVVADWISLEMTLVEVEATSDAGHTLSTSYSFEIEDLTTPEIEEILWLTPRRARIKFDEPVLSTTTPGGSRFIVHIDSGVEVVSASTVYFPSTSISATWIGATVSIANSYPENAGPWTIVGVDTAAQQISVNATALIADDGVDTSSAGTVVRRRNIEASVSPYHFVARLNEEGLDYDVGSAHRIQCAFCPLPVSATVVTAEEIPNGEDIRRYVYVEFNDDISIDRLYTLHGNGIQDLYENEMVDSTLEFTSPGFNSPSNRLTLWSNGLISGVDRRDDMEADGYLRKLAVVMQDLINTLWYRIDGIEYLDDPGRCPVDWVDHMLYELGNPFRFPIETELLKRKLANALPGFYKKVGTARGIEGLLYLLLGIHFTIITYNNAGYWILGFSVLGDEDTGETVLGPGTAWARNAYEINSPLDLTVAQRRIVTDVATWADPADMHLVRIVEPSTLTPITTQYWTLGYSALGLTTTLGE